ncbi:hypothetical protein [Bradyrhizobium sp.]|uniref:hypothetical protein n=1 Tax=Bradyrhizobium sp. TaxID=376 RepID=UPI0025BCABE7|nr:hypothetical protein [Bradyrhizobium sp.]
MTLSTAGLIGAAVGLAASSLFYFVVTFLLKRQPVETTGSAEERERGAAVIQMILLADIPLMTAVGYYVGQLL